MEAQSGFGCSIMNSILNNSPQKRSQDLAELVIFIPSLRGGGLEKSILKLAVELNRQNVDLDFVVANTIDSVYSVPDDLPFVNLNASRIIFTLYPLIRYLKKTRPRVLFSAGTPLNSIAIAARFITGYPKRLVVGERNHLSSIVRHSSRLRDKLRPYFVRFLYPFSDLVLAVSKSVADDVSEVGGLDTGKVWVTHNIFDIDQIIAEASYPTNVDWIDNKKIPVLVCVGRMVPQKGYSSLLKAFSLVRKHKECRLIILGDGEERKILEKLAGELLVSSDVYMPGFVQNPYSYIAKANLLVHPSLWEGLPGVLIEALACGTPIVSTDSSGGASEILENGKYGTLVPPGSIADLADAILYQLDKETESEKLIERARFFSAERILLQYMKAFDVEI